MIDADGVRSMYHERYEGEQCSDFVGNAAQTEKTGICCVGQEEGREVGRDEDREFQIRPAIASGQQLQGLRCGRGGTGYETDL